MNRDLTRSSRDRVISGVCGGFGEYFSIDPVIIRIGWVLLSVMNVMPGILAYIICIIAIPEDSEVIFDDYNNKKTTSTKNTSLFIGLILIMVGGIMLVDIMFPRFFSIFNIFKYWPILLILAGIYIIAKQKNK